MVESVEFSRPGCVQFGYACHCHRWRNSRSTRGTSPYCSQIDGATHMSLVYSCERPLPQKSCAYSTRSCNTDKYIFSLWSNMLNLWNFRNWQFTVYSSVSTMQSARCLSILSSARSVLLHMVLYSIWIREWMTEPTDCRGKGRKTWRRVYSTNFIQFQPHNLHIYVESGISRWRNTRGLRHLLSLGQIRLFSQISSVPNTGVRAIY